MPDSILQLLQKFSRHAFWQKFIWIWCLGALGSLAMPPAYVVPALIAAIGAFYIVLSQAETIKQSAGLGFGFFLGYFMVGLYWINFALLVDHKFIALIPLAMFGLPGILSVYGAMLGCGSYVLARRWPYGSYQHAIGFVFLYAALEWVRGHALSGFPWNLPGYAFGITDVSLQSASVVGVYGLTGIMIFFGVAMALLLYRQYYGAMAAIGLIVAIIGFGTIRLQNATTEMVPNVYLRLVQANIEQSLKWDPEAVMANFNRYRNLSAQKSTRPITHIIWPETAVPYPVDRNKAPRIAIAQVTPKHGSIILGAPRGEYDSNNSLHNLYNSLIAIDRDADIIFEYDKSHLVPFGEYVPLPNWLGVQKITHGLMDYSAGPGPITGSVPGLPPFSPLICYEVIFPSAVQSSDNKAEWLLNITNDGWYGNTAGPYQHLAHARMRAAEEGLPLIRVANTGISAVVDAYGRIIAQLPLGEGSVLDTELPKPAPSATFYKSYMRW